MFFPSTYPSSRRPCRNALTRSAEERKEAPRYPIRGIFFGCCASALAPHIASVTTRATIPTNFRFWILRRGSGHALDFRLSEQEFKNRFSNVLCTCFSSLLNRKSAIENRRLFNHLIRPRQHRLWNRHTDLLRRFEIDHQLELLGPLHGKVGGFCSLENLIHVLSGAPEHL